MCHIADAVHLEGEFHDLDQDMQEGMGSRFQGWREGIHASRSFWHIKVVVHTLLATIQTNESVVRNRQMNL